MDPLPLFAVLNAATGVSHEQRQAAQTALLAMQRDAQCWPFLLTWLHSPDAQLQFFAAQALLIRINCDFRALSEEQQLALRDQLQALTAGASDCARATRNKLDEAMAALMRQAFLIGWWKDPVGDAARAGTLGLLGTLVSQQHAGASAADQYAWQHALRAAGPQVLRVLDDALDGPSADWLACFKAWTDFGALPFRALQASTQILPRLLAQTGRDGVVDALIEAASLAAADESDEAAKARCLVPALLGLAWDADEDVARLAVAVAEACVNHLAHTTHDAQLTRPFLERLLALTDAPPGTVIGVDDRMGPALAGGFWYLLAEGVADAEDEDGDVQGGERADGTRYVGELFAALQRVLLARATMPEGRAWAALARDQQQDFVGARRDYLDVLPGCFRVLRASGRFFAGLLQGLDGGARHVEARLRALLAISDALDDQDAEGIPGLPEVLALLLTAPQLQAAPQNARLTVSAVGEFLPAMRGPQEQAACALLLQHVASPITGEEAVRALLRAADLGPETHSTAHPRRDTPGLLRQPHVLQALLALAPGAHSPAVRTGLFQLLARLLADLPEAAERARALDQLLAHLPPGPPGSQLLLAVLGPWAWGPCPERTELPHLAHLRLRLRALLADGADLPTAGAALAALARAGPRAFTACVHDVAPPGPWDGLIAGAFARAGADAHAQAAAVALVAPFVLAWRPADAVGPALRLLLGATAHVDGLADEPLEGLLDLWARVLPDVVAGGALAEAAPLLHDLLPWCVRRLGAGALGVPLLRALVRLVCAMIADPGVYACVVEPRAPWLVAAVLAAACSGRLGRSGVESSARIPYDLSLAAPDAFRRHVADALPGAPGSPERAFLRDLGAAHTISRFRSVFVDFALARRGL